MNFNELLNKKMSEIEPPRLLPKGMYLAKVSGPHEQVTSGKDNQFSTIIIPLTVLEASDQIEDRAALEAYGDVAGKSLRIRFMFNVGENLTGDEIERNERTLSRLQKFLEDTLDIKADTLKEALAEIPGRMLYANVSHSPNKENPEEPYTEVRQWAPAE